MLPISEKVYRRLLMLNNVMTTNLPQTAGLNPKGILKLFLIRHCLNFISVFALRNKNNRYLHLFQFN